MNLTRRWLSWTRFRKADMRDHFIACLAGIAGKDPRVILVTGDLGFKVFDDYSKAHPRQFLNAGVAEQNMTGLAAGLALENRIAFTYSIANFSTLRCLEQIRNDAAYHDLNVKVVAVGGGFSYGALGMSHHATEDLAILRSLPAVKVFAPGDVHEATEATRAVWQTQGTCYLRLDKSSARIADAVEMTFVPGKARLIRAGADITLVATGGILIEAVGAADQLKAVGIDARVLSMHTVKPLDYSALEAAARETGGLVTIEEHNVLGGLGGAAAEHLLESGVVPKVFARIGLKDQYSSVVGSQDYLRQRYGLDANAIREKVIELLALQGGSKLHRLGSDR